MSAKMFPKKKRKLNSQSESPSLSAFAARKSLQDHATKKATPPSTQKQGIKDTSLNSNPTSPVAASLPKSETLALESSTIILQAKPLAVEEALDAIDGQQKSSSQSRAGSPEVLPDTPAIVLTSWMPSKNSVRDLDDGALLVKLAPGERLVILGQFDLSIRKGRITLLGATLLPSKSKFRVYVPLSHSLPVIRCLATDINDAEICLYQSENSLNRLKSLSPLFGRLWNEGLGPLGQEHKSLSKIQKSSFQILFSSGDRPKRAFLQPIISAPEWNEALSRLSAEVGKAASRIMVSGPKSSGKSTFTKLLSNRLLSATAEKVTTNHSKSLKISGVAILDLDPGQPEYYVPGQLSLIHVQEPNFGPPFSHPIPDGQDRIIRAHTIAAITPSMDPSHYMACALDLFAHYRNLLSTIPNCPLIINTPGWILGTGLEILVDLINKIRPTEIIYMSQTGPTEVVDSLQEAAKATPVITLPSQVSEYVTKTAAHLRTMQFMSYFHLDNTRLKSLYWSQLPLTSVPPWEIRYSGEHAGILGIVCYGEQPPSDLLLDSINGALVAVVVVDDMVAIPGWQTAEKEDIDDEDSTQGDHQYLMDIGDMEIRAIDDDHSILKHLERPLIVQTPKHNLPYFNPANAISLDPKHSYCIGVALVRGIDVARQCLQVITPISPSVIVEMNEAGKSIVLVSGKLDTPGWAYTEGLMYRQSLENSDKSQRIDGIDVDEEKIQEGDDSGNGKQAISSEGDFQSSPWIERQEGSQGRVIGSRVWRVRRDLGKSGD